MKHFFKPQVLAFLACALLSVQASLAQKGSGEVQNVKLPFTKEMEDKVATIVQPVKETLEKLFKEDQSGNYAAYAEEVRKLDQVKSWEEKKKGVQNMQKKYYPFIKKIWDQAKIDEKAYQQKLRDVFPPEMKETIRFTEFLNFTVSGTSQKPTPPPPPPPPPPSAPANICMDAATKFFSQQKVTQSAIGKANVFVIPSRISTDCVSEYAGHTQATGWTLSDIKIPGTFPSDNKKLRITKTYTWNAYATAITILGSSFATICTSTDNFSNDVFIRTWAPVVFGSTVSRNEVRTVQTVISKQSLLNTRFGITAYCDTFAGAFALSVSSSNCDNLVWSICEE